MAVSSLGARLRSDDLLPGLRENLKLTLRGRSGSATIRSKTRCQLLALEHDHFEDLLSSNLHIERAVHDAAQAYWKADARRQADRD